MDRVIWDSWHKFVYYDEDYKEIISKYSAKTESEEPIAIYVNDEGLPKIDKNIGLDKYLIKSFHERYYGLLIFLSIINNLINNIDRDVLNLRFGRLFRLCSISGDRKITDVIELRDILEKCMNRYKKEYINYIETGVLGNFYNELEIPFVLIDTIVPCVKKSIGLKKYFSLLLDIDSDLSIFNQMAINDYIASRCTGYLSVNVLLDKYDWKYYYSNNGQFIQDVHDYSEIDLRKNKDKVRSRHN